MTDQLNKWEKAALFTTGAGGAYNILLYQLGYTLADAAPGAGVIWWTRVLFGVISFVGFDLTLVVTVRAMREGRRSRWAWMTVVAAALAAGGIALDVSAVAPAPVLHAAPVAVLALFMLHLAAPKNGERVADLKAEVARLAADLKRASERVARAEALVAARGAEAAQAGATVAERDAEVARLRREVARRPQDDGAAWFVFNGQRFTLAQLSEATGTPGSTLRRKLAPLAQMTAQAAD